MMKSAEKRSNSYASSSLIPKQMHKIRFGPRVFERAEDEHETPADAGSPLFKCNLMNIPVYPPAQRKEAKDNEKVQAETIGRGLMPVVQMVGNIAIGENKMAQGKFLPIQRKVPCLSCNLMNIPAYPPVEKQVAPKPNLTGMPDKLKDGVESLSGIDMSYVRVYSNSDKPAKLRAQAYTQGCEIYLGPGQEKHLPHEAWHVVQQRRGIVKPTIQTKTGIRLNDNPLLEEEADRMGGKALQYKATIASPVRISKGLDDVVQCNSFEDFNTYEEAKNATKYSWKLLDSQKNDKIGNHFQREFDESQRDEIYKVNKAYYKKPYIVSDSDGTTELSNIDIATVANVDHRYPRSKNGTNNYTNAAVISAISNIRKGNSLLMASEPETALNHYKKLSSHSAFGDGKVCHQCEFSSEQREAIFEANRDHYGMLTSDEDGTTPLIQIDTGRIAHVDHILARSEGGTNYYFNAQVLPASENIHKSGKKNKSLDLDFNVSQMSLVNYYKAKQGGKITGSAIDNIME